MNIDGSYITLFFPQLKSKGRKLKDNYALRLFMTLLPYPEGKSPTELQRMYRTNMKHYNLLWERNKVAQHLKILETQKFLYVVDREDEPKKKGAHQKYYTVNRSKFLRFTQGQRVTGYDSIQGLNVFIRIIEKNKLYYNPELTTIQSYFISSVSALRFDENIKDAQRLRDPIDRFRVLIERYSSPFLPKIEVFHDNTKLEKFNYDESRSFIFFFTDNMLALWRLLDRRMMPRIGDMRDVPVTVSGEPSRPLFNPIEKHDIDMLILQFTRMKELGPKNRV